MRAINIDDLKRAAERRLPKVIQGYLATGAGAETTLRANQADFALIELVHKVLVDVTVRDMTTVVLGQTLKSPLILAPVGLAGLLSPHGEIAAARAAKAAGIAQCLSTVSVASLEDVTQGCGAAPWMQLYIFRDRSHAENIMARAHSAGCPVLVVTVDSAAKSRREGSMRTPFFATGRITPGVALDFALHPRWTLGMALAPRPQFGNIKGLAGAGGNILSQGRLISAQQDMSLTWATMDWVRRQWSGKLVIKGIMEADDARRAADAGADGIVVSNHGGRQLEGASSTIRALPAVIAAVGDRMEVLLDSGIRRGQDVVKAMALGARACMVGRPWLYGLAASGEDGVRQMIDILASEIETTVVQMGFTDLHALCGKTNAVRTRF